MISGSFRHYQYADKRTVLWLQRTCLEVPGHCTPRLLLVFVIDAFHIFVCVGALYVCFCMRACACYIHAWRLEDDLDMSSQSILFASVVSTIGQLTCQFPGDSLISVSHLARGMLGL